MIRWVDSDSFHTGIHNYIKPAAVVLDIGCGIRPQQYIEPNILICIEPHTEYVDILRINLKNVNAILFNQTAEACLPSFPDRSVDTIFLIDVIEHLEKDAGSFVIKECTRIARQQVIIFTPLGFMPQEIHSQSLDGWNLNGGKWQEHKSGWYPEDFVADWTIFACRHLHFQDFHGKPITPPYGAFYAVKNITPEQNEFNLLYASEITERHLAYLETARTDFPKWSEGIAHLELQKSLMKCALRFCQITTEFYIKYGDYTDDSKLSQELHQDFNAVRLIEAREFIRRVTSVASEFDELSRKAASLDNRESEIERNEIALAELKTDLEAHAALLASKEAELEKRTAVHGQQLLVRLNRRIKDFIK